LKYSTSILELHDGIIRIESTTYLQDISWVMLLDFSLVS